MAVDNYFTVTEVQETAGTPLLITSRKATITVIGWPADTQGRLEFTTKSDAATVLQWTSRRNSPQVKNTVNRELYLANPKVGTVLHVDEGT